MSYTLRTCYASPDCFTVSCFNSQDVGAGPAVLGFQADYGKLGCRGGCPGSPELAAAGHDAFGYMCPAWLGMARQARQAWQGAAGLGRQGEQGAAIVAPFASRSAPGALLAAGCGGAAVLLLD
jgi:hypothetical protein